MDSLNSNITKGGNRNRKPYHRPVVVATPIAELLIGFALGFVVAVLVFAVIIVLLFR